MEAINLEKEAFEINKAYKRVVAYDIYVVAMTVIIAFFLGLLVGVSI